LDDAFFLGVDPAKKHPLKLTFKTITAANQFLAWTKTSDFHKQHSTLSAGRDMTKLRKVGVSRLMASAEGLRQKYGSDIFINPSHSFVRYGGVKYDALDFAAYCVIIDGEEFDVQAACEANPEFEVNGKLAVAQGDEMMGAFVKKRVQRSSSVSSQKSVDEEQQGVSGASGTRGRARPPTKAPTGGKTKKNVSNTAPPVSGLTTGNVYVQAGPSSKYRNQENLSIVGAMSDRFSV
jgi:hypothetical protein